MAEYIEREAAMPALFCEGVSCQDCPFLIHPINGGCRIADYIKSIPSADVKPVVLCKDCKHRDPEDGKCDKGHTIIWQLARPDEWYCADGERRGNDNG